ncbi:MAG: translation initiation factor [Chitinophagales bacterium]|nr:translation initiation factor [Chitinophagales bacterium]
MAKKKLTLDDLKGVVFSTNPDYQPEEQEEDLEEALAPNQQLLYVSIDRKKRKGKEVTLVEGFLGHEDDLKELGSQLKKYCGVGGSIKDEVILIQGNFRDKIIAYLEKEGYKVKRKGG